MSEPGIVRRSFARAASAVRWTGSRLAVLGSAVDLTIWPAVYAVAIGVSLWLISQKDGILKSYLANKVPHEGRLQTAMWVGGSFLAILLIYFAVVVIDRWRKGRFDNRAVFERLNTWLRGLLALPIVMVLAQVGVEKSDPLWTMFLATLAGLLIAASAYSWPLSEKRRFDSPRAETIRRLMTGLLLVGLWAGYGYLLTRLAISHHHALNTRTADLGYYDNIFYQSLHGRPLGCSFVKGGNHASAHFDPILVLLSPLYLIYDHAETLLTLQSVWLGAGVIPIYLIAKRKLESRSAGLTLAFVYTMYPALHGTNLYEFHSLTLITPLVLWAVYFLEEGHIKRYAVTILLLLLCREDVPLMVCFIGAYAFISGDKKLRRVAIPTIVVAFLYFVVVKVFVMPGSGMMNEGSKQAYSYQYYFRDMIPQRKGITGLGLTLLSNPMFVLRKTLGNPQKILYLLQLFVPLALFPLVAKRARVMMVYGLLVAMLASRKPVFQIHFQYAAMVFPFAFAITPRGMQRLRDSDRLSALGIDSRRFMRACLIFMLVGTAIISWKFGALVDNTSFRGGFMRLARPPLSQGTQKRWQHIKKMVDRIPPGARVAVTGRTGPQVSNRQHVYFLRQRKRADYVFVDERQIKKKTKKLHDRRKQSKELIELDRYRTYALFRVDPSKRAATKKLASKAKKAAKKKAAQKKAEAKKAEAKKAEAKKAEAESRSQAGPSAFVPTTVPEFPRDEPVRRGVPTKVKPKAKTAP